MDVVQAKMAFELVVLLFSCGIDSFDLIFLFCHLVIVEFNGGSLFLFVGDFFIFFFALKILR